MPWYTVDLYSDIDNLTISNKNRQDGKNNDMGNHVICTAKQTSIVQHRRVLVSRGTQYKEPQAQYTEYKNPSTKLPPEGVVRRERHSGSETIAAIERLLEENKCMRERTLRTCDRNASNSRIDRVDYHTILTDDDGASSRLSLPPRKDFTISSDDGGEGVSDINAYYNCPLPTSDTDATLLKKTDSSIDSKLQEWSKLYNTPVSSEDRNSLVVKPVPQCGSSGLGLRATGDAVERSGSVTSKERISDSLCNSTVRRLAPVNTNKSRSARKLNSSGLVTNIVEEVYNLGEKSTDSDKMRCGKTYGLKDTLSPGFELASGTRSSISRNTLRRSTAQRVISQKVNATCNKEESPPESGVDVPSPMCRNNTPETIQKGTDGRILTKVRTPIEKFPENNRNIQKFYIPESAEVEKVLNDRNDRRIKSICDRFQCDIEVFSKVPRKGYLNNVIKLSAPCLNNLRMCARALDSSMNWCIASQIR